MNKARFIKQLRLTARELKPLTLSSEPGSDIWDGTMYVKTDVDRKPNPHGLSWWSVLVTMAELLEGQECPLSTNQVDYIRRLLFGGMGSLNDLQFAPETDGPLAEAINQCLDVRRRSLFESLHDLSGQGEVEG